MLLMFLPTAPVTCEIMDGLCCVAAPIFDRDGSVRYAVSVSGLESTMQGSHMITVRTELMRAAESISYAMGYRGGNIN